MKRDPIRITSNGLRNSILTLAIFLTMTSPLPAKEKRPKIVTSDLCGVVTDLAGSPIAEASVAFILSPKDRACPTPIYVRLARKDSNSGFVTLDPNRILKEKKTD